MAETEREYGVAATVLFPLVDFGATDFESTPVTFAAGDTQLSQDEAAFGNATNDPVHEGNGIYSLALTAAEMQAARLSITIIDQTATKEWEDQAVLITTYGNASAQHAFNRNVATPDVNSASLASVLGALTDAAADGDPTATDTIMQYVKQLVNVLVGSAGVVTYPAAAAPANGVSLAEVLRAVYDDTVEIGTAGAGLTNINLPNQAMDITGNITGNLSGSAGSVTGAVGSVAGNVDGNVSGTVASVVGAVGSIGAAGITSASFGVGAIDAAAINSDAKTIERNTAFSDLEFLMVLTSDHVTPATGLTVTGQRSIDGAAFGAVSGAIAEVGNGIYQFDALAADTNGGVITYRFSSATADDTFITITTEA